MIATATANTIALVLTFLVLIPAVVTGVIVYAVAHIVGERRANDEHRRRDR